MSFFNIILHKGLVYMGTFFQRLVDETQQEQQALFSEPKIQAALNGEISLATYVAYLEQAYHHVKHTVPLLMAAGSRLSMEKEFLREALGEYVEEEMGHQEWILSDIAACGADAEAVRHGEPSMPTEVMVAYAYDSITRMNPVGFFGMVFVLEGTSTQLATNAAQKIQKSLNLSDASFSYLSSHGVLDLAHMTFFENLVNKIEDEDDQKAIIHVAKRIFVLFAAIFQAIPTLK